MKETFQSWYKKYIKVFLGILAIGLLSHFFILTNKIINHDELHFLFSKGNTFELGRWGLELIKYIFPNISMQFLYGSITLILIAISACILFEILDVKNRIYQILIGGVMITFPSVTSTLAYMFTASSYGVAILLAILAVYLISKENWKSNLIGVLSLTFSLSIYQGYITLFSTIYIIVLLKEFLNKEKSFKKVVLDILKFIEYFILSLVLYYVITNIVKIYFDISFSFYQGIDNLSEISLKSIFTGIIKCYETIYQIFITNWNGIAYNKLLQFIYLIITILNIIVIINMLYKAKKIDNCRAILIFLLISVLPISMNLIFVINSSVNMHTLMVYANLIIFILPLLLLEEINNEKMKKIIKNISTVSLFIVIFEYSILANECYTKLHLSYENTYAFFNTLSTRIQSVEGFNENTKVVILGKFSDDLITNNDEKFKDTLQIVGISSTYQLISSYDKLKFLEYYIGVDFEFANSDEIRKILKTEEFQEMNIYPYDNSIKMINNIIVVNL